MPAKFPTIQYYQLINALHLPSAFTVESRGDWREDRETLRGVCITSAEMNAYTLYWTPSNTKANLMSVCMIRSP